MSLLERAIVADKDIEYASADIQKNNCTFKITTMTILVSLDSRVEIKSILSQLSENVNLDERWDIRKGKFLNCLLLTPKNIAKKVSIKVFSNGNLHMTGVKSFCEALGWAEKVSDFLGHMFGRVYHIDSFNVQLINGCFGLTLDDSQLCLNTLQSLVPKDYSTVFQPDAHPGLRIKYSDASSSSPDKKASIIVFRSGKVLVNAFLSGRHLLGCYNFITDIINNNRQTILKSKGATQKFKGFDYAKYLG